jgi:hypothetical protein
MCVFHVTSVSNKTDALPKNLPPISISLLFGGVFAAHISHGSSIATRYRKIIPNI